MCNKELTAAREKMLRVIAELDLRGHRADYTFSGGGRWYNEMRDLLLDAEVALRAASEASPSRDTKCKCGHAYEQHGLPDGQICHEQIHYNVWCECSGFIVAGHN